MPHGRALGTAAAEALAPKSPPGQARRARDRMVARDRWTDALHEA